MPTIVAILNRKGGTGKTTLATNISVALQKGGAKVLLVDSDPLGSARDWHTAGGGDSLPMIGLDRPTIDRDIKAVTGQFDWIVVDGAPLEVNMSVATIKCADIVLIPVQPSPYDIWAVEDLVDVIKERQSITGGKPKTAFVISRQIKRTTLGNEVRDALTDYQLPVFEHGTFQRVIYAKAAADGKSVIDAEPEGDAAKEVYLLIDELKKFKKGDKK